MQSCKCGCGELTKGRRVFVNKEHQLTWMHAGGAREMNALLPLEVRQRGGHTAGTLHVSSGVQAKAAKKGGARAKEIAAAVRARRSSQR